MMARRERNLERSLFDLLPLIEFVHDLEAKVVHQIPHADRNHDRLVGRYVSQRAPVEMIEMRVGHEHEVDRWQMIDMKAGTPSGV